MAETLQKDVFNVEIGSELMWISTRKEPKVMNIIVVVTIISLNRGYVNIENLSTIHKH